MEKVDIIKLMKKEKEEQDKLNTNYEEEKYIKLLHQYFDDYIHYNLLNLAKNSVITYNPNSKNQDEINKTNENKEFVLHTIQSIASYSNTNFDRLNEEEKKHISILRNIYSMKDDFYSQLILKDFYNRKGNDNLDILNTHDKEFKKEVANRICNMLIEKTNIKRITHFYKRFVVPIFKSLYKINEIDFDITSKDDKTNKIKTNILTTLTTFIIELIDLTNRIDIDDKDLPIFYFIYIDDKDINEAMATHFVSQFLEIYKTKEFQDYLNSNANGCFDINIMTEKELEKHNEIISKYEMIDNKIQEIMICGIGSYLIKLNDDKVIIFDLLSKDERIKTISNNILTFLAKLIKEMALNYLEDEKHNENEKIGIMKYLFLDNTIENVDKKKKMCRGIMNVFEYYYHSINFEDTDYIENIRYDLFNSKEISEEDFKKRIINMINDKEDEE